MTKRIIIGATLGLFLFLHSIPSFAEASHIVKRAVDGDTLVLANGERVRLIGVDTPEVHVSGKLYQDAQRSQTDVETIQALGKRASDFTKKIVQGERVWLSYDQANAHLGHRDRYGRLLAYVYLEDGTLINAEIIRQGYGNAYTKYPFSHMEEFRQYEKEAREYRRGLWADDGLSDRPKQAQLQQTQPIKTQGNITVYITKTGSKYHRGNCRYLRKSKIPISLEEAKRRGYTPCSVCKPPR